MGDQKDKDPKVTDSIPRTTLLQIFQVLGHLASSGGKSTFEQVRLFIVSRSQRAAPASQTAKYTVARAALLDLQRLEFIQAGMLPRTQSKLESLSDARCELTESGRALAYLHSASPGRAFDQLLFAWLVHHSYFRLFVARLHEQPIYMPDVTSVKQVGTDIRSESNLDTLARRITSHCLKRLEAVSLPTEKVKAFSHEVGARVQDLGRTTLSGLDAKKWVDIVQDRVVIPALLTAEGMPFTDAVTLQHLLKAAKDFFVASWTTSHPQIPLRVIFPTCEFEPAVTTEQTEPPAKVIHHGKSYAMPGFLSALRAAYDRVPKPLGTYADAYAVRALVCIELQIQPKIFALCLRDLMDSKVVYTELPFEPPPTGEDYLEVDRDRIGSLKLADSQQEGF